jgi:hypothetical protein
MRSAKMGVEDQEKFIRLALGFLIGMLLYLILGLHH